MLYRPYNLQIALDLTTYCNAKCPQCHRTNANGLARNERIPLTHVSKEKIFKAFPREVLSKITEISLVPTWGDTMMHPDIYEIVEYFLEVNKQKPFFSVTLDTNGSLRDEDFWFKFGGLQKKVNGPHLRVNWDIDGHEQHIHSHYRRNTDLSKVLRNMEAFSSTLARCTSQTILFKHNQPYMKEIKELAEAHGSLRHTFVASERFYNSNSKDGVYTFTDENGEVQELQQADTSQLKNPTIAHIYKKESAFEEYKKKVVCRWSLDNKININYDGQVWPCCYFGYSDIGSDDKSHQDRFYSNELIQKYNEMRFENNIYFTPLLDILKNKWWTEYLPESIEKNPIGQCTRNCSMAYEDSRTQWRTTEV